MTVVESLRLNLLSRVAQESDCQAAARPRAPALLCGASRVPSMSAVSVGRLGASAASEFALSRRCKAACARGSVILLTQVAARGTRAAQWEMSILAKEMDLADCKWNEAGKTTATRGRS